MATIEKNRITYAVPATTGMYCVDLTDKDAARIKTQLESHEIKPTSIIPVQCQGGTKWIQMMHVVTIDLKD